MSLLGFVKMKISNCLLFSCLSLFSAFTATDSYAVSSAEAFNRFINSSPEAKAELKKAMDREELTAGCMNSANDTHHGFAVARDGSIYEWSKTELDSATLPKKKLLKIDKKITDRVFSIKESNGFDNAELDYIIDGTSYCYVTYIHGSRTKYIAWPRNEIMGKGKKVPESAKEVFNEVVGAGAVVLGMIPESN